MNSAEKSDQWSRSSIVQMEFSSHHILFAALDVHCNGEAAVSGSADRATASSLKKVAVAISTLKTASNPTQRCQWLGLG